jgi:predicted Zn-dependent peptidase
MVDDTPDDIIHDIFAAQIWPGHPLGRPILGTRELVTGFSRDAVAEYFEAEYVAPRVIIAVAGNVTHDHVVDLFGRGFSGREGRAPIPRADSVPKLTAGVNIVHKQLEQVHVVMGLPGLRQSAPERYALFLLNDVMGGSMSSRLFQEVRERQGLVYSIHSGVQAYRDTGVLYFYAATDPGTFSRRLKSILKEIRDLRKNGSTADELKRAKDHLKGSLMLSLETSSSRMNRLARHEMQLGSFMTMDQMIGAIEGVKHEEVQTLVGQFLDEERLALTTLGPLDRRNLPREFHR